MRQPGAPHLAAEVRDVLPGGDGRVNTVFTAYCSAGRPNASQPVACSTLKPRMRLYRLRMSVAV
jgi:hypothetical protein